MSERTEPQLPRPWCAQCCKPVEKIMWREDASTRDLQVAVECHGENETIQLNQASLFNLSPDEIRQGFANGTAFEKRQLT